ncbi:hypothetical protein AAC978_03020 [Desulfitobacterium sp. THU1]
MRQKKSLALATSDQVKNERKNWMGEGLDEKFSMTNFSILCKKTFIQEI